MTIKLPIRNLIIRSASSSSDDGSVSSSSSSSSTFLKLRRRRSKDKPSTTKKSVSFDLDSNCTHDLPISEPQEVANTSLWYSSQERQQFKKEKARQIRLLKEGRLPETEEETSLGLDTNRSLTRCKREYCYDAVLGEQVRLAHRGNCSKREAAERIATAYLKVQATFEKRNE